MRVGRLRAWARETIGGILHLPRTTVVDGVRYRERVRESLQRTLSPTGEGEKEYDVRFPGADAPPPMTIRFTRSRRYADLAPSARLPLYRELAPTIRPGQRVFELGCGTGEGGALLAELVGPSGGVVAVGADRESIRYARRRYRSGQLGYEHGGVETLSGELDGSFDTVILTDPPDAATETAEARGALLGELWRVVQPGGSLILCQTSATPRSPGPGVERLEGWLRESLGVRGGRPVTSSSGASAVVATKPEPTPAPEEGDEPT